MAAESPGRALFLHGRLGAELESGSELEAFELRRHRGQWSMDGYSQRCDPASLRKGLQATTWFLAKSQPPLTPTTWRIKVDVGASCVDREDLAARAEEPVFDEIAGKLVMTIWLRPQSSNRAIACASTAVKGPPLVVDLPAPLAGRELFDGGIFPPSPAMHLAEPKAQPLASVGG